MKLTLVFVCFFCVLPINASELGQFSSKGLYRETNEGIYMRSLEFTALNHRRDLFWEYEGSVPNTHDLGLDLLINDGHSREFDIKGQRLRLIYGHQFDSNSAILLKFGAHQYKASPRFNNFSQGDIKHSNPVFDFQYLLKSKTSRQKFFLEYENVYLRLQLPAGVSNHLRFFNLGYDGNLQLSPNHTLSGGFVHRFYSDENQRTEANINSVHKIANNPWIPWLGVGINYLSTKKNINGYWTPRSQTGAGPRIQWSYWHSQVFSAGLYSNINYFYNSSNKENGVGHYTAAMFWIGDRNKFHAILELVRMDSEQDRGSPWHENDISITLSHPW